MRAFLNRDRAWAAWPLCSLGRADWPFVQLWQDEAADAALWALNHPSWGGAVQTFGGGPPLDALIEAATLPRRAFLRLAGPPGALGRRYRVESLEPIVRMSVTPALFRPPAGVPPAELLGPRDGAELTRLYAGWPAARFHVGRLTRGYRYQGVRLDGALVAAAENVLRSTEEGVAIVQGVYVEPRRRGQGLARAVTAALTAQLFAEGARDVALDVRADNHAAQAAYARLGYLRYGEFAGGTAEPT